MTFHSTSAHWNRHMKAGLLASTLIAVSPAMLAEDAADDELRVEAITVYGTSNPLPIFDYPGQVTVVDREALETIAPSAVSDLLRDVPGLDFSGGPRRTGELPSIRGLSGQNVLILLDGARQSFTSAHDLVVWVSGVLSYSLWCVVGG